MQIMAIKEIKLIQIRDISLIYYASGLDETVQYIGHTAMSWLYGGLGHMGNKMPDGRVGGE